MVSEVISKNLEGGEKRPPSAFRVNEYQCDRVAKYYVHIRIAVLTYN